VTPDENAEAIAALDLPSKVTEGVYQSVMELDERRFLLAAKAAPALGPDVFIVLLLSPF
jgi:hypothetical protein